MSLSLMLIIFGILCLTGMIALVAVVVGLVMENSRAGRESTSDFEQRRDSRPATEIRPAARGSMEDQIRDLLGKGGKIQAIKVYREATGASLKEAKDAVEAFENGARLAEPVSPSKVTPAEMESQVRHLLARGLKIEAMRAYREASGVGLKDAKEAVEAIEKELGV